MRLLEELFKGILALTRKTPGIKQLEVPMLGAAAMRPGRTIEITIYPDLTERGMVWKSRRELDYLGVALPEVRSWVDRMNRNSITPRRNRSN